MKRKKFQSTELYVYIYREILETYSTNIQIVGTPEKINRWTYINNFKV